MQRFTYEMRVHCKYVGYDKLHLWLPQLNFKAHNLVFTWDDSSSAVIFVPD